jgi:Tfp pilus assembly protein PilF
VQPAAVNAQTGNNARVAEKLTLARRIENTDPKRARQLLREVLQADPSNENALEDLSRKMLADENLPEARELAARCANVNTRNPLCERINNLAVPITPETERMAEMADACLQTDPNNIDCLYGKAQWSFMNGKPEDAEHLVERLNELNPKSSKSQMALARLKAAGGSYSDARELFQAACAQGEQQACWRSDLLRGEGW